jgi:hypothetical protein
MTLFLNENIKNVSNDKKKFFDNEEKIKNLQIEIQNLENENKKLIKNNNDLINKNLILNSNFEKYKINMNIEIGKYKNLMINYEKKIKEFSFSEANNNIQINNESIPHLKPNTTENIIITNKNK